MADFVAVLRKTMGGLGETTPEIRQKVYAKARTTISAKLAAMTPPPPAAAAERQMKALEDAIATVEADYKAKEEPLLDPIEELESAIESLSVVQPNPAAARPKPDPAEGPEVEPQEPGSEEEAPGEAVGPEGTLPGDYAPRRKNSAAILVALGVLVLIAGAGYAAWLNKDDLTNLFGYGEPAAVATDTAQPEEATEPEESAEAVEEPAEGTDGPEEEMAAVESQPETPGPAPETPQPEPEVQKFTQRLNPDGSEVDMGQAGDRPEVGEGTSVAAATQALESPAPLEAPQPDSSGTEGPPTAETEPLVAVGQKAIFYEERTNQAQGSAETGSIVWSLVQESPGGELPPEPVIRAEATIPGKGIQLRMTVRRNGDQSLPASHIIEMIFLTPDNFEGGGIANVQRIALKESEQSPGNPLLGIPAKIADGFFLVALTDGKAEVEANTTMLRRQSWIDIPIIYRSGRRALITMEKGIPGDKVFDEALKAWQAASSG